MIRRDFLRRLAATAAGLLVADDALELLAEPRRVLVPGTDFEPRVVSVTEELYREWEKLNREWFVRQYAQLFMQRPGRRAAITGISC